MTIQQKLQTMAAKNKFYIIKISGTWKFSRCVFNPENLRGKHLGNDQQALAKLQELFPEPVPVSEEPKEHKGTVELTGLSVEERDAKVLEMSGVQDATNPA